MACKAGQTGEERKVADMGRADAAARQQTCRHNCTLHMSTQRLLKNSLTYPFHQVKEQQDRDEHGHLRIPVPAQDRRGLLLLLPSLRCRLSRGRIATRARVGPLTRWHAGLHAWSTEIAV